MDVSIKYFIIKQIHKKMYDLKPFSHPSNSKNLYFVKKKNITEQETKSVPNGNRNFSSTNGNTKDEPNQRTQTNIQINKISKTLFCFSVCSEKNIVN